MKGKGKQEPSVNTSPTFFVPRLRSTSWSRRMRRRIRGLAQVSRREEKNPRDKTVSRSTTMRTEASSLKKNVIFQAQPTTE
jgi:hypothetical protein